uniref:Uncharacterized protein n=1 Tax=viral metagenome TaxID=1070528 RepID=A0A6M3L815_9ZZZZ
MDKAELHNPEGDKNFSIHFYGVTKIDRLRIRVLSHSLTFPDYSGDWKMCQPFLQGDSDDWMMIEFWTDNIEAIIRGCEYIEKKLNIKIEGL